MADPINLNKARKHRARLAKEKRAAENRVKHGRTKAQKTNDKAERSKQIKDLSNLRIVKREDSE